MLCSVILIHLILDVGRLEVFWELWKSFDQRWVVGWGLPWRAGSPCLAFPKRPVHPFPPAAQCPHPPLVSVLLKPYFLSSHQSFCLSMPVSPKYGCFLLPLRAGLWESKLRNPPHQLRGKMVKRAGGPICQAAFATSWYWASSLWHSEGSPADWVQ